MSKVHALFLCVQKTEKLSEKITFTQIVEY